MSLNEDNQYPEGHANRYEWKIIGYKTMGASQPIYVKNTEKGLAGIHSSMEWALRKGALRVVIRRGNRVKETKEVVE